MNSKVFIRLTSLIAVVAGVAAGASPAAAIQSNPDNVTLRFTDAGEHAFTVPQGVASIHVVAVGEGGHSAVINGGMTRSGGFPEIVSGIVAISSPRTLYATVDYGGGHVPTALYEGGHPGGDGGGASDVRVCPAASTVCSGFASSLSSRLLVAAGGGGAGAGSRDSSGGDAGTPGSGQTGGAGGGQPGTDSAGGAAGTAFPANKPAGHAGDFGVGGGDPDDGRNTTTGGGGGGGGWYGGGAGGPVRIALTTDGRAGAGGGGGSSYIAPNVSAPTAALATTTDAYVEISYYDGTAPAPTIDAPSGTLPARPTLTGRAGHDAGDDDSVTLTLRANGVEDRVDVPRAADGSWSWTPDDALASGTYTIYVSQGDSAGNDGASAAFTAIVDGDAPDIGVDSVRRYEWLSADRLVITGHYGIAPGDGEPHVTVNGESQSFTWTPPAAGERDGKWSLDLGKLASDVDGIWGVDVFQADAAGNHTEPSIVFFIDTHAPTAQIDAPVDGGEYAVGQDVRASYSCDDAGSGVASCDGPVASGAAIDTATAGAHSFSVTAVDQAGNPTTREVRYTVLAAAGGTQPAETPGGGSGSSARGGSGGAAHDGGSVMSSSGPHSQAPGASSRPVALGFASVSLVKGRAVRLVLTNANARAVNGSVTLQGGRKRIGRAAVKVGAAGRTTVTVRLTAAARKRLAKAHRLRVTITVMAGGTTARRTVTLRAPVRK